MLAGLIFHLSRAGSTLVLKTLGTWPEVSIVDEPPELDRALTAVRANDSPGGSGEGVGALRDVLSGFPDGAIVKTDAWHALELARLLEHCPGVPWIFVYRNPVEVLVSHIREPGSHTVPGVISDVWFGPPDSHRPLPHAARVLGSICTAVLPHAGPDTLVNFDELTSALDWRLPAHFGLDPATADRAALADVFGHHAKRPYLPFAADAADKRAEATPELRELAEQWVGGPYRALEAVRCGLA